MDEKFKGELFERLRETIKIDIHKKEFDDIIQELILLDRKEFANKLKEKIKYCNTLFAIELAIDQIVGGN